MTVDERQEYIAPRKAWMAGPQLSKVFVWFLQKHPGKHSGLAVNTRQWIAMVACFRIEIEILLQNRKGQRRRKQQRQTEEQQSISQNCKTVDLSLSEDFSGDTWWKSNTVENGNGAQLWRRRRCCCCWSEAPPQEARGLRAVVDRT